MYCAGEGARSTAKKRKLSDRAKHDRDVMRLAGASLGTLRSCAVEREITMSWQSYVDDHLIGTGHVVQGAICGVDGAIWAASAGFNVRPRASRPVPSRPYF